MKKEILIVVLALLITGGGSYLYFNDGNNLLDDNQLIKQESHPEKGNIYSSEKIGLTQQDLIRRDKYYEERDAEYVKKYSLEEVFNYYKLPIEDMYGNLLNLTFFGIPFKAEDNESYIITVFRKIGEDEKIEDLIKEIALDFNNDDLGLNEGDKKCEIISEYREPGEGVGPDGDVYYIKHPDYDKQEYSKDRYDELTFFCGEYGRKPWEKNIFYILDGYLVYKESLGHSFDYVPKTEKLNYYEDSVEIKSDSSDYNMKDSQENNFTIDLDHRNNHPTFGGGETILTIKGSDNEILNTIIFSGFLEQKFNYENKFYYEQISYESEGELYILDLDKEKLELMYLDIGNLGIYDEKSMTYVGTGNTEKEDAVETCSNSESGGTRYQSAIKILNLKTGKVSILLGSKNNRFDIYKYSDGVIRYGLYEFDIDSNEGCIIGDYIGTFEINI